MILNANPNPEMMPVEMTQHKVNYFMGKDPSKWQKGISTSKAVIYKYIDLNVDIAQIPGDYSRPVHIKKDIKENIKYKTIYPNHKGITTTRI